MNTRNASRIRKYVTRLFDSVRINFALTNGTVRKFVTPFVPPNKNKSNFTMFSSTYVQRETKDEISEVSEFSTN